MLFPPSTGKRPDAWWVRQAFTATAPQTGKAMAPCSRYSHIRRVPLRRPRPWKHAQRNPERTYEEAGRLTGDCEANMQITEE